MKKLLTLLLLSFSAFAYEPPTGVLNGNVTQENTHETVCISGYTDRVRPPVKYTNAVKHHLVTESDNISDYELDHYVPLELGGSPTSTQNLWLEPWDEARKKDVIETQMHRELCTGKITLKQAQDIFLTGEWKNLIK